MRTKANFIRNAALTSLFALCASPMAFAQTATPTSGLGQAWPNASDLSANPNWHVYVFQLNGVKYIQVNDLNGTVHAAVGTANGASIVLPIGVDSQNVSTADAPASSASSAAPASSSSTQTVYSDSSTTVTASPQSNGATLFKATTCQQLGCSGGAVTSSNGL